MWLADHGTSGPEVVLAVGVAPSRRWAEQWYGLVVAVAPCSVAGCGPGCVSPSSPHALLPAVVPAVVLAVVPAVVLVVVPAVVLGWPFISAPFGA